MRRFRLLLAACAAALTLGSAQEVQSHGLVFERWVRDTFFDGYKPASYTQRWDIPAAANRAHGAIPVNPKAVKHGTAVDLGDALRQYEIDEPFLLIIGFWSQDGDMKRINGWSYTTNAGVYGTSYLQRALVTYIGLGANRPQDAVYPTSLKPNVR